MFEHAPLVFTAAKRTVTALDASTGEVVWSTKLPGIFGAYTTMIADDQVLYAARNAKLHCLDKRTGEILWTSATLDGQANAAIAIIPPVPADADPMMQQLQTHAQSADDAAAASSG